VNRYRLRGRKPVSLLFLSFIVGASVLAGPAQSQTSGSTDTSPGIFDIESLDGTNNNQGNANQGAANTNYPRVGPASYVDGKSKPVSGPNSRFVSNRIINDVHQNIFSDRGVSQWGNVWGQFLDHNLGLRNENGETANIPFNANDPQETFSNDLNVIPFNRSGAAPGTGVNNTRQQVNTVSSYIDADVVYGGNNDRLEWLREGSVDGNVRNNGAHLMLSNGYLPQAGARGDAASAPSMEVNGRLLDHPDDAFIAGDRRANENIALSSTHTLFAREHNRIVDQLPFFLTNEQKFQIARKVVIGEIQFITYNEFLPAMGVTLAPYQGYDPNVDASVSNEFAAVGFRGHSQIHGEILDLDVPNGTYTQAQLDAFEDLGIDVTVGPDATNVQVPIGVGFFNPQLLKDLGEGVMLKGIGHKSEYNNDEMIDNQLRSTLFQIPVEGNPDCVDGVTMPECFHAVVDLGAIDIERARDHGIPKYNDLRKAYGLAPKTSFTAITGEATESLGRNSADDPRSLEFVSLADIDGNNIPLGTDEDEAQPTSGVRRTTTAARLKAVYKGDVNAVDAFTGMIAEKSQPNSEMGELEQAIWKKQFEASRNGDRFYYQNNQGLATIRAVFGIDFRTNLGDVIARNTDVPRADLEDNVFFSPPPD